MNTKSTILSQKESKLLENLIADVGLFVTFKDVAKALKKQGFSMSRQEVRNLVSKLVKNGWFVRIKKGTYYITTLESRGFFDISELAIAQVLEKDSYISCESALRYHGMFDQHLNTVTSVSLKQNSGKTIQGIVFEFIATKEDNFYGWKKFNIEGQKVKIATAEKAILDLLRFRRNLHSVDLVLEKLRDHQDSIDIDKLNKFSEKQSITVKRILGFLLDRIEDIDSDYLYNSVKKDKDITTSSSYITKDSDIYNAKWRLYYHKHFKQ